MIAHDPQAEPKILLLIVAYQAQRHIAALLARVDATELPGNVDVLVLDDASEDATYQLAREYAFVSGKRKYVARTPCNQGYGGNQKVGYRFAIERGYDVVVLLHGDGQYPPEYISALMLPILDGSADVVLGSRMAVRRDALRGGMPMYKWCGNIVLTMLQNQLLGTGFSEFHSGFRAYRVSALAAIPFEHASNRFEFDTEILIQCVQTGKPVAEIPIPTHYGDEICYVNLFGYAYGCIKACVLARIQSYGIGYQRKFDYAQSEPGYSDKTGFASSHSWAVARVASGSTLLDIGCGKDRFVSRRLLAKDCRVLGVDLFAPSEILQEADARWSYRTDAWHGGSLLLNDEERHVQGVLLLDVLEHVEDPEACLAGMAMQCQETLPLFYITTPNIAFVWMRIALLCGQFHYSKKGILDRTHRRLFTFSSLKKCLEESGYIIESVEGIPAPWPLVCGEGWCARLLLQINRGLIFCSKGLFSYQIAVTARVRSNLDSIMMHATGGL